MTWTQYLASPGEHALTLDGQLGTLEASLVIPEARNQNYVAFLGHPHSLQGGTMNNKVVTTLARVFKELRIPSLRFNFRGVGQSQGTYDQGVGESEDMIGLARLWQQEYPSARFIFAGFSFGSYVAYRSAIHFPNSLLLTIAPPVHHYNYQEVEPNFSSWHIIQGDADEVVPYSLVDEFAKQHSSTATMSTFTQTGHFFHGKLIELKSELIEYLKLKINTL